MTLPEACGVLHDDVTGITCERAVGHPGEHEGYAYVTWANEEDPDWTEDRGERDRDGVQ